MTYITFRATIAFYLCAMSEIQQLIALLPATSKWSYDAYYAFSEKLVEEGKTTGTDQSPAMIEYSRLNLHRMKKWNKVGELLPGCANELKNVKPQTWYVLSEPWCGDAAQSLPFISKMAGNSEGKIELVILLRDENPSIMDRYLTNGGRSIPKLIALSETGEELFTWGPRPEKAQELVVTLKNDASVSADEMKERLHKWYAENKGKDVQQEILNLIVS